MPMRPGRVIYRLATLGSLFASACAPTSARPAAAVADSPTVAVGFYTTAQADSGQAIFGDVCAVCHGTTEFRGPMFQLTWMAEPIGDFFQHISIAMPQDDPGTLTPRQYAAIVAYVLRLNGRSPGDRELPANPELLGSLRWED